MERVIPYYHTEVDHNNTDPSLVVPVIYEMFKPKSVCDVGCGTGNFLHFFKQQGTEKVLGLDGEWANKTLLEKHLCGDEFLTVDFEESISLNLPRFEICLSLEVAEHISEENADSFVDFLTSLSDLIIFSAALPFQGGINHINEQKEEYWEGKFKKRGFQKHDIIRPRIFFNHRISGHYRRNMVVYSKKPLHQFIHVPHDDLAIQDICQERLYKSVMAGELSTKRFSTFFLKVMFTKLSPKKLSSAVKKLLKK